MLLCEATIGGTLYRFSDRWGKLDHIWQRKILSFSSPTVDLSKEYGGWLALSDGKITFSADFYAYPPPLTIDMKLRRWLTAETGELLFDGTAILESFNKDGASYRLFAPAYTQEAAAGTVLSGTIVTTFTTAAAALGLTLDSTGVRSTPPAISYTTTSAALWTDLLSSAAEFFSHIWWIDRVAGKLYLRAMETANGSAMTVAREFFTPTYTYSAPTCEVDSTVSSTVYRQASSNGLGKVLTVSAYHSTAANINAELSRILGIVNGLTMQVALPIGNGIPLPNQKVQAVDRKCNPNLNIWCLAQKFAFDFAKQIVTVSGKGGVSAI